MSNFINELEWRGMLQDSVPGIEDQLIDKSCSGYIGFDPTADSLHIGSLVQIIILMHFQKFGHKPIVLVGGATGMIGDPSGKSNERNLLSKEELDKNIKEIKDFIISCENIFENTKIVIEKNWKDFLELFDKKNITRKECLLLPLRTVLKALKIQW